MNSTLRGYGGLLRQLVLVVLAVLFLSHPIASAAPMPQKDIDELKRTNAWFSDDPVAAATCGGGSVTLTGANNEEKIWNFFITKGLQPYMAAGFLGNIKTESAGTFDPRVLQTRPISYGDNPTNGQGFGLIQWTFADRQQPLVAQATAAGVKASDLGAQLNYIWYEISEGQYKAVLPALQATADVTAATQLIETKYEVHAAPAIQPQRTKDAISYLAMFGSGATGGTAPAGSVVTGCAGGAGELVGNLALPLERKWYDQHKDWFTKPHHDTPAADIPVPRGTPVYSMTDGVVRAGPIDHGFGKGVEIDAGNGIYIKYAHGIDGGPVVHTGDTVKAGQLIMYVDSTGQSTGDHLHLEIDLSSSGYNGFNGTMVCPQSLLVALYENQPIPAFNSLPTSGCVGGSI